LEELLSWSFFSGVVGAELVFDKAELPRMESLDKAPLDCRGRIEGSEMFARALCVLSRAAAAKARIPLEDR
jgi:hypothetical protein